MPTIMTGNAHAQAEKIYKQVLDLLEELSIVYANAGTDEVDDEDGGPIDIEGVIADILEEAVERGLDEESAERIFKSIAVFAEKASEG